MFVNIKSVESHIKGETMAMWTRCISREGSVDWWPGVDGGNLNMCENMGNQTSATHVQTMGGSI